MRRLSQAVMTADLRELLAMKDKVLNEASRAAGADLVLRGLEGVLGKADPEEIRGAWVLCQDFLPAFLLAQPDMETVTRLHVLFGE